MKPVQAKRPWTRGLALGPPIVLGYVPIGFAYGVLAIKSGLSPRNVVLMSLIVYAGASQFIAAGLFAAGRLAPLDRPDHLCHQPAPPVDDRLARAAPARLALAAPGRSLPTRSPTRPLPCTRRPLPMRSVGRCDQPRRAFCVNVTAQVAWISGSWLGVIGGQYIPDPSPGASIMRCRRSLSPCSSCKSAAAAD